MSEDHAGLDERLLEQGTGPLWVRVPAAAMLQDLMDTSGLYGDSFEILSAELDAAVAGAEPDLRSYVWHYHVEHRQGMRTMVTEQQGAPPAFDEARWREDLAARGMAAESVQVLVEQLNDPTSLLLAVAVTRDDDARSKVVELEAARAAVVAPYERRLEALEDQRDAERTAYAYRVQAELEAEAQRRYPGAVLVVDLDHDFYGSYDDEEDALEDHDTPAAQLLDHARMHTPLPGSGIAPIDYPAAVPIAQVERDAGRLPHTRLRRG
ncbi:hypothetical protein [Nocardioides alkalitolerans]|uniref:hypothetical protein n=1 Tax=Nocardioides alkalitolerans TaxID=281714 RepID=UPI0003FBD69B|nr:hypothetical protein [Nocardioides alkalitolerans]